MTRRWGRWATALVVSAGATLGAFSTAHAVTTTSATLTLSLPTPYTGCTFLDAASAPETSAILDLVRPSAFVTTAAGGLVGESGAIATAELTSLSPQTVVYTIAPHQRWSNGATFDGRDLVTWWRRARALPSVLSDGYRDISSLTLSANRLTVTARFAQPYSDWELLFRDVEYRGASDGCSLSAFLARPSLGPYRVVTASSTGLVLVSNPAWTPNPIRFGRIVVRYGAAPPTSDATPFVSYAKTVDRASAQVLGSRPSLMGHIGSTSLLEEMTFAPRRPLTRSEVLRQALSWSVDRASIVAALWGQVTFSPSVAASAIYSQGSLGYPGGDGRAPTPTTTTTTTPPVTTPTPTTSVSLADCVTCAVDLLRAHGYRHTTHGWITASGTAVVLRVVTGPSGVDRATGVLLQRQWQRFGISVYLVTAPSELAAATTVAFNNADVAIFARPTVTSPSFAARSWVGPAYADSYPSGVRLPALQTADTTALGTFNPVTARSSWRTFDQVLQQSFWVRPLFTPPSLLIWTPSVGGVYGSASLQGLVDEVPTWSAVTPSASVG